MVVERNNLKNAVYVGDTEKDRISAKTANCGFIHAAYGFGEVTEKGKAANTFADILDIVPDFE